MAFPRGPMAEDVTTRRVQGRKGHPYSSSHLNRIIDGINIRPELAQVDTITVDTAADETDYTVSVNGASITYTAGVGATKITIAAGLLAAILAEPLAGAVVTGVSDGVDTITLTGIWPGQTYTVTDSDANLTTASSVTATAAESIGFGLALVNTQGYVSNEGDEYVSNSKSTYFTAQVITVVPTYVASAEYTARVIDKQSGRVIADFTAVADTSLADLLAELEAGLDAQLPANTVEVADPASTSLTFTAELAGYEFDVEFGIGDQGASLPTFTKTYTTGPTEATSFQRAFKGVSESSIVQVSTIAGSESVYPGNSVLPIFSKGKIWVETDSSETIGYNDDVYVELDGTGDDYGRFYNTTAATRVQLPRSMARWERAANSDTGNLGLLYVDAENRPV